jgi:hypothetical protein
MNCPVCNNPAAEDITPDTFDSKTFRCPTCGEYDIVHSVYDPGALKRLEEAKRRDALDRARILATVGHRPRITTYDL